MGAADTASGLAAVVVALVEAEVSKVAAAVEGVAAVEVEAVVASEVAAATAVEVVAVATAVVATVAAAKVTAEEGEAAAAEEETSTVDRPSRPSEFSCRARYTGKQTCVQVNTLKLIHGCV